MKRDDSVFFFTLIDFLVQVLFFGLAFYTAVTYANSSHAEDSIRIDRDKIETVTRWTDAPSIPKLAGMLGGLSKPHDSFSSKWAPFIASHEYDDVVLDFDLVTKIGGRERVEKAASALGKPSCVAGDAEKNTATTIADLRLTDDQIVVEAETNEFQALAKKLKVNAPVGTPFTLEGFKDAFQGIVRQRADCRYFVTIKEDTRLVAPRNAVDSAFYFRVRR